MDDEESPIPRTNSIGSVDHKIHKASPSNPANKSALANPRSCVTCRRRKVRCDKKHPCSNCSRANIECIYPAPGRAPRKPRKPQDPDLSERLRRLESLVQSLGTQGQTDDDDSSPKDVQSKDEESPKEETHDEKIARAKKGLRELMKERAEQEEKNNPPDVGDLTNRFGTLIAGEGRSRYISPGLWASLNAAVVDIKDKLEQEEEEEEEYGSPNTSETSSHQAFLFGLSSTNVQMNLLHPSPSHVPIYWEAYKENVDPLFKFSHTPSMEKQIHASAGQLHSLNKASECTMFAIYYAATTSMSETDCLLNFGEAKNDLLLRYRFAMEQSLARADFLRTDSVFVLKSFVLFLMCLRRYEDAKYIWSMSALAVRIAQGLGVHRDGSHYPNLSPFMQEMRRRLWWTISQLDLRASEDLGADFGIHDTLSDAQLPRNLNDEDISLKMTELPESRKGGTDMTFSLIRCKLSTVLRKVASTPSGMRHGHHHFKKHKPHHHHSLAEKKMIIETLSDELENDFLRDIDESVPIYWLAVHVARLVISKMYLMIYHEEQRKDGGKSLPQDVRDMLFKQSMENIELSFSLRADPRARKFEWLLETYMQWHPLAFILNELCERTTGPDVDRAWRVADTVMKHQADEVSKLSSHLWKPLKLLRAKAKHEREKALAQAQTAPETSFDGPKELPILVAPTRDDVMAFDFNVDRLYPPVTDQADVSSPFTMVDGPSASWNGQDLNMSPVVPGFPTETISNTTLAGTTSQAASANASVPQSEPLTQAFPPVNDWSPTENQDVSMMDPTLINWATWDDMVQEYNMQNEMTTRTNGGTKAPTYFGPGTNWY